MWYAVAGAACMLATAGCMAVAAYYLYSAADSMQYAIRYFSDKTQEINVFLGEE